MQNKNILVIPHTPHMHIKVRSFEIARTLALRNNVYYLLWDEVNDFSLAYALKRRVADMFSSRKQVDHAGKYETRYRDGVTILQDVPRAYAPVRYADRHNSGRIDEIIDRYNIGIVINASFIASPVRERRGVTYIYDLVDDPFDDEDGRQNFIRSRFIEKEVRKADLVTACSKVLADHASRLWGKNVHYLPNGTNISSFEAVNGEMCDELRTRWGLRDRKVVGFISNFEPWNGLPFLAGVFELLSRKRDDVALMLVGSGRGLDAMRGRFEEMENVVITGPVPPDEVAAYFSAMDIGILPFERSALTDRAMPIKIIEYGACRKHVVATPLAELKRQNFPNVHLVERSAQGWVESIERALEMDWDRSWDRVFERFSWSTIVDEMLVPAIEAARQSSKDRVGEKGPGIHDGVTCSTGA